MAARLEARPQFQILKRCFRNFINLEDKWFGEIVRWFFFFFFNKFKFVVKFLNLRRKRFSVRYVKIHLFQVSINLETHFTPNLGGILSMVCNLTTWRLNFIVVFLPKRRLLRKFYVNILTGSGVMTKFFDKQLNQETENDPRLSFI